MSVLEADVVVDPQLAFPIRPSSSSGIKSSPLQVFTWLILGALFCYACNGTLWFRAQSSAVVDTYGTAASGSSSKADNVAILAFLLLTLSLPLFLRARAILRTLRENPVFFFIPAWASASFLWSQIPLVSMEWAPATCLVVLFACYLHCSLSSEEQIRLFLFLGTICLVVSVLFSAGSSTYRDSTGAWSGIYTQKNICCMVTEFLLLPVFYARSNGLLMKLFRVIYTVSSIGLILMTQSATGRITLALTLAFVTMTKVLPRLRTVERKLLLLGGAILTSVTIAFGFAAYAKIARELGKDPTLTGRIDIWSALIPSILKHPFLGYGYRAFWRGYQGESAYVSLASHWAPPNAHNALLEIWVTLGLVGVALILFTVLRALKDGFLCLVNSNSTGLAWCASTVFLMLLLSVDEAEYLNPFSLMWLLYILACLGLTAGARELRRGLTAVESASNLR
jgi:exopolysaccharide production protein ExoQ